MELGVIPVLMLCAISQEKAKEKNREAERAILRMSSGELEAMGELYELIKADAFAFALSRTSSIEDAEDITHETFVQIWKCAKQYKPMGKPLSWVFAIEMNMIRRQYNLRKRVIPLVEYESIADEDEFAHRVIENEFLRQLMCSLDEEERTIISLHAVSGLKHREIAELMKKPLSTILSKYNRAIKKLQEKAQKMEGCK